MKLRLGLLVPLFIGVGADDQTPPPVGDVPCADLNEQCSSWAAAGECEVRDITKRACHTAVPCH